MSAYTSTKRLFNKLASSKKNDTPQEIKDKFAKYSNLYTVTKPEDLERIFCDYKFENQEYFLTVTLDSGNHITDFAEITKGLVNKVQVHARESFRFAVKKNACSVIFMHNHPSGSVEPSEEDLAITRILCAAGKILQINVLDHFIIGKGGFTSICRRNPEWFNNTISS